MSDPRSLLERETRRFIQPEGAFERLIDRRDRKRRNQRIRAGVLGLAIAIALGWLGINAIRSTLPVPAVPPEEPSVDLGIFEPIAGRIVYMAEGLWVVDDVEEGVLAVDPNGPSDTKEGPKLADDVASSLVRLDLGEDALPPAGSGDGIEPLGWSSDGTELLVTRWVGFEGSFYVVHADGTRTRISDPSGVGARTAAISPDGTRVAFESEGLVVADVEGGRADTLPLPAGGEPGSGPLTFSADGTQIAYLSGNAVWVVNADGTDAHEILPGAKDVGSLTWSPAGDRIAIAMGGAIYTFAPDGSDLTKVIGGGVAPFWSPDGSQIAYTIPCHDDSCPYPASGRSDPQPGDPPSGLAVADADGSNVRTYGFAASGPWHPGA